MQTAVNHTSYIQCTLYGIQYLSCLYIQYNVYTLRCTHCTTKTVNEQECKSTIISRMSYGQSYFAKLMNTHPWINVSYTEGKDTSTTAYDIVPCTDIRSTIYYRVRCTAASGTAYDIVSCTDTRRIIYYIVRYSCISHTYIS